MNNHDVIRMRDYVDMRLAEQNRALELAAKELSRRLDDLNHSHAQLLEMQTKYIDKTGYEFGHRELTGRIVVMEKIMWGLAAIVAFLSFALPLGMHFLVK